MAISVTITIIINAFGEYVPNMWADRTKRHDWKKHTSKWYKTSIECIRIVATIAHLMSTVDFSHKHTTRQRRCLIDRGLVQIVNCDRWRNFTKPSTYQTPMSQHAACSTTARGCYHQPRFLNHLTRAQNGQIRISIDGPLQFCTLYVGLSPANDITSFDPLSIHISISIWVPHHRHWYGTQSKARDDQEDQGSPGVTHWQRMYTTFQWHKMALEKLQMTGHSGEAVSLNVWTD